LTSAQPQQALAALRRARVGTTNPPKIEAVRLALSRYSPEVEVEGAAVESGVSEQPVGFPEILRGARNRARAALEMGECDLAVGIEDGLVSLPGVEGMGLNIGCAIVTDGEREGFGTSSGFGYPQECLLPAMADREPIGELFDQFWRDRRADAPVGSHPSSLSSGNVGKLSLGVLPRSEYVRHAVLCALIPFLHPDFYTLERPE
jgi:inosine/xanthosine triphosphatase